MIREHSQYAIVLAIAVAALGCGGEANPAAPGYVAAPSGGTPAVVIGGAKASAIAGASAVPTAGALGLSAGSGSTTNSAGSGLTAAAGSSGLPAAGASGAGAAGSGAGVPSDVAQIVSAHCSVCHGAKPQGGAPMSLVSLADFQAPAKSNMQPLYTVIPSRINATDQTRLMPPVGTTTLTAAELKTFNTWLTAGAPGAATNVGPIGVPTGAAGSGAAGGAAVGAPADAHQGGASVTPIDYNDPDMQCYKFLSHAQGDFNAPYQHGPGEEYVNFTFKAPWKQKVYLRAVRLVAGDAPILHHWLIYKDTPAQQDGLISGNGTGSHPTSALLYGYAPGATPLYLDSDVGVELGSDVSLTLEVHIYNSGTTVGMDHNGAELCVTTKAPVHVADLSWLGTESIIGTSATGHCTPKGPAPIHVIAAQPHEHKKGMHMKVTVNRASGMDEVIHDEPFSFDNQKYYVENTILNQGDTLTTTCTYSSPATFGQSTNDEMCYFFTLAWPAGSLGTQNFLHGANVCE